MAAIDLNLRPSTKQLKQFGWIGCLLLPVIGWLFAGKPTVSTWATTDSLRVGMFVAVGAVFGVVSVLNPKWLKWPFVLASVITFPIGFVLGEFAILLIFVIGFVPIGLLFRMIGRDVLDRSLQRDATSYWQTKKQPKDSASYFRQS